MEEAHKKKTTIIYWVLLVYVIAALLWWLISLLTQNEDMYRLHREALTGIHPTDSKPYQEALAGFEDERKRNQTKYVGEGITFLVLILFGAVYVYRSVRKQFRLQLQQQNFVMAITHELKTPIAVSRLNLETLQRHKLDEPKREKLLQLTLQETMRLDALINNILISSQLDVNAYSMNKEELNLSDLVQDVAVHFAARYPDRKLNIHITPEVDLTGDALLLKLMLSNFLENANKYSPADQSIGLKLSRNNKYVLLEVSDLGSGINADEKKEVFKKFYRIGNETTRVAKGTGLGLYLCKKIAEDHKGTVVITDNQPQGSNFIVSFRI
ncbi:MAG: sensor histidine kinase [Flavisolibacter sp.]